MRSARCRKLADGKDLSLVSIQGYIAAQSRKARDSCPHADGPLRTAWLEGYEAGIKAMTEWGENVSHSVASDHYSEALRSK